MRKESLLVFFLFSGPVCFGFCSCFDFWCNVYVNCSFQVLFESFPALLVILNSFPVHPFFVNAQYLHFVFGHIFRCFSV